MKIKKKFRNIATLVALSALSACNQQVESDWAINKGDLSYHVHKDRENEKIIVRETEFPFNAQIVYVDNYTYGSLDAVGSAFATVRGMGFSIVKSDEEGFDKASEHYRKTIFPLLLEKGIVYMSSYDEIECRKSENTRGRFLSNGRYVYDFEGDGFLDLSIGFVMARPGAYHPTRPTQEEQKEYQESLSK